MHPVQQDRGGDAFGVDVVEEAALDVLKELEARLEIEVLFLLEDGDWRLNRRKLVSTSAVPLGSACSLL